VILFEADYLLKNSKFDLARDLFDKMLVGHKVIETLSLQETEKRKSKKERDLMEHLKNFMFAALKYKEYELALKKAR
jgi:hypothetical protein